MPATQQGPLANESLSFPSKKTSIRYSLGVIKLELLSAREPADGTFGQAVYKSLISLYVASQLLTLKQSSGHVRI